MITQTDIFNINRLYELEKKIFDVSGSKKVAYFDIETTGFNKNSEIIYLIGAAYKNPDGTFTVIQWFNDNGTDEMKMLLMFREFLKDYDVLVEFNGNSFDIPFVEKRGEKYGIHFHFEDMVLIDIYREIKKYKNIFPTIDLKQKSIERFLGILREDEYNGGQLIEIYKEYIASKGTDKDAYRLLMLHNHDDIIGLVDICDILAYVELFSEKPVATRLVIEHENIILESKLKYSLRTPLLHIHKGIKCKAEGDKLKIMLPVYNGILKHFYDNPKDYFYLPDEDMAIHKSVAQFVDRNHRVKCSKDNCYVKKSGRFIIQFSSIFTPDFKENVKDKHSFCEVDTLKKYADSLSADTPIESNGKTNGKIEKNDCSHDRLSEYISDILKNVFCLSKT